jgi:hypothetical protein
VDIWSLMSRNFRRSRERCTRNSAFASRQSPQFVWGAYVPATVKVLCM